MTSVIFDDGFYVTAKAGTSIDNSFRGIISPLLDNGSLQRIYIRVRGSIGLPLNGAPPEKVKGIQIWAWWGPNILFPKFDHIVFAKSLVFYRNMGWGAILLPNIIALGVIGFDPWQYVVMENTIINVRIDFLVSLKKVWWHATTITGQDS